MGVKTFPYSATKHVKYVLPRPIGGMDVKKLDTMGVFVWECPLCTMCHIHEDFRVVRGFAESHWQRSDHGRWELWE